MGRFRYEFSNLCGSAHRGANLLFSPDGKKLFSAVGGRVTMFDLVVARSKTFQFECSSDITAMSLSTSGRLLLVVDEDGHVLLANVSTGSIPQRFTVPGRVRKNSIRFSPCDKYFAIGVGRKLEIWRIPSGDAPEFSPFERLTALTHHRDDITSIDWSMDSQFVVSGSRDQTAKVFFIRDLLQRKKAQGIARVIPLTIFGHKDHVVFVSFLGKGSPRALLTLARDGTLYCWCFRGNEKLLEQYSLEKGVDDGIDEEQDDDASEDDTGVKTGKDDENDDEDDDQSEDENDDQSEDEDDESEDEDVGSKVVCADVRLSSKHNLKQGRALMALCATVHEVTGVLSVGLSNGIFALFELPVEMSNLDRTYEQALFDLPRTTAPYSDITLMHSLSMSSDAITTMAVNETGEWIAVGVASLGQLIVWEWRSETHVLKQQGHLVGGSSLAYSPDGRAIVTGGDDGRVKLWAVHSGFCTVTFSEHNSAVTAVDFAARDVVVSSSLDGTVRCYDLRRYRCFRVLVGPPPRRQFSCVAADSAGELVAAGCRDTFEVVIWSLRTGRVLDVLAGHTGPVSSLAFHPANSGQLATGSWDASVRLWEIYSDAACEVLPHDKEVLAVAYRPDGEELAAALRNGEICLWDPETAQEKGSIDAGRDAAPGRLRSQRTAAPKKGFFRSICYSGDGHFLLGAGDANVICAYSVADGRDPSLFQRYPASVNRTLEGVTKKLNSKELTYGGVSVDDIDHLDDGADDYEQSKRKASGLLPGVDNERRRRRASTRNVRFSPTGRTWAAMTSEGLLIFSSDVQWASVFDPTTLDVEVTEETARLESRKGNHSTALHIALRLGNIHVLSDVLSSIPLTSFPTVLQSVKSNYFERLVAVLIHRFEKKPHLGFDMEFTRSFLLEMGYRASRATDSSLVTSLRALQRIVTVHWERLSRVCESNGHKLNFLLSQLTLPEEESAMEAS